MTMNWYLRDGKEEDMPAVYHLVKELAEYERCPQEVETTLESMRADAFGEKPIMAFMVAEMDGKVVGLSLYFMAYSSWKGRCLYLEDLVVTQSARGLGIGKALFEATARKANQLGVKRLMWQVLEWNHTAIEFYKSLGSEVNTDWYNGRLYGEALIKFGQ